MGNGKRLAGVYLHGAKIIHAQGSRGTRYWTPVHSFYLRPAPQELKGHALNIRQGVTADGDFTLSTRIGFQSDTTMIMITDNEIVELHARPYRQYTKSMTALIC